MAEGPVSAGRAATDIAVYALARLLLVIAVSVLIYTVGRLVVADFPLAVAVIFALIIALPLGIWVFGPLRRRATASVAAVSERRRRDREELQARLRGE